MKTIDSFQTSYFESNFNKAGEKLFRQKPPLMEESCSIFKIRHRSPKNGNYSQNRIKNKNFLITFKETKESSYVMEKLDGEYSGVVGVYELYDCVGLGVKYTEEIGENDSLSIIGFTHVFSRRKEMYRPGFPETQEIKDLIEGKYFQKEFVCGPVLTNAKEVLKEFRNIVKTIAESCHRQTHPDDRRKGLKKIEFFVVSGNTKDSFVNSLNFLNNEIKIKEKKKIKLEDYVLENYSEESTKFGEKEIGVEVKFEFFSFFQLKLKSGWEKYCKKIYKLLETRTKELEMEHYNATEKIQKLIKHLCEGYKELTQLLQKKIKERQSKLNSELESCFGVSCKIDQKLFNTKIIENCKALEWIKNVNVENKENFVVFKKSNSIIVLGTKGYKDYLNSIEDEKGNTNKNSRGWSLLTNEHLFYSNHNVFDPCTNEKWDFIEGLLFGIGSRVNSLEGLLFGIGSRVNSLENKIDSLEKKMEKKMDDVFKELKNYISKIIPPKV